MNKQAQQWYGKARTYIQDKKLDNAWYAVNAGLMCDPDNEQLIQLSEYLDDIGELTDAIQSNIQAIQNTWQHNWIETTALLTHLQMMLNNFHNLSSGATND